MEWSADCNGDGIVDKGQILSGEFSDSNNNGIPDGPAITHQPTDQSAAVDAPVSFIVEVAHPTTCTNPVIYQWQRRDPTVIDANAPNAWISLVDGNGFFNTQAAALVISHPTPALATGYRCRISGGCGCDPNPGAYNFTHVVNYSVACPADFNADGGIDGADVQAFFEHWEAGC